MPGRTLDHWEGKVSIFKDELETKSSARLFHQHDLHGIIGVRKPEVLIPVHVKGLDLERSMLAVKLVRADSEVGFDVHDFC